MVTNWGVVAGPPTEASCTKALQTWFVPEDVFVRRALAGLLEIDAADDDFAGRAAVAFLARFAVFTTAGNRAGGPYLVFRTADGICIMDDPKAPPQLVSHAVAEERLRGARRISGPDLGRLPVIPFPELPTFDRRWLPDVAMVVRHLAPWQLEARVDGRTLRYTESGLPAVGVLLTALGTAVAASESQIGERFYRALDDHEGPAVAARHAQAVALVRRLAAVDNVFWGRIEIKRPGDFVRHGLMNLEEAAVLNGGQAVADAAAADRIGLWQPNAPQTWRIPLEDRWVLSWSQGMHVVKVTCTSATMFPHLDSFVQPAGASEQRAMSKEGEAVPVHRPSDF